MAPNQKVNANTFSLQVVMLILHIMRNLRSASAEMDFDIELSYPQILTLYALLEKGTSTMSEISNWLKISHGVATRTVDRLVQKGMVERRHDDADRRVVLVSLSRAGEEYIERMISFHLDKMSSVFEGVTNEQRQAFLDFLKQIDRQLEK
jgi:MarR family 2-MHQ and catechol resistance regulon transcriptional repressor